MLLTLPLGPLQANCYIYQPGDSRPNCLIIDPGADGDYISQVILEHNLKPQAIFLTHGHFDHVLGLLPLYLNFQIPIYLHQADFFLYKQANKSSLHWTGEAGDPVLGVEKIKNYPTNNYQFSNYGLSIIPTPGHTPGSVCLYDEVNSVLFSGDTIFADGVGRTDFSYSSEIDLKKSLAKIRKLPAGTTIYPGHGEAFKS